MKFKIAVVQFETDNSHLEKNLEKAEVFIKKASFLKAKIIIFPEDFITGPIMGRRELVDFNNKYKEFFQSLARKYSIDIVAGSFVEGDNNGSLFNTSYYINFQGRVRAKYRKINLWSGERKYLSPGNQIVVFNTRFGKAGLIICWDLAFPEIFRRMVQKGVKIIYCPSFWTKEDSGAVGYCYDKNSEVKFVNSLCVARAFENEVVLVYCNSAGYMKIGDAKYRLLGQSQITVPFKGALKILNHANEEMFIQEVDVGIIKDAECVYKIRKDLKTRFL